MRDALLLPEVIEWHTRPLCCRYPVVLFETLRVEIQEKGAVRAKSIHVPLGVDSGGYQELLGLWIEETTGQRFWLSVLHQLESRGVERIRIALGEKTEAFSRAIRAVYPKAVVQWSISHLIHESLGAATPQDRALLAEALRPIYAASNATSAQAAFRAFAEGPWGSKYPTIRKSWETSWKRVTHFFALPREVRRNVIVAAAAIENLQPRLARQVRRHGCFPSDDAAIEFVWTQRDLTLARRPACDQT